MIRFKINKRTRVLGGILASTAFIALAIWGWGLPLETALMFLLICVVSLIVIVIFAAITALLLRLIRAKYNE